MASRMLASVSSSVLPVVMQPGRSGTYAAQLFSAFSNKTAYLTLISPSPTLLLSRSISECLQAYHLRDAQESSPRSALRDVYSGDGSCRSNMLPTVSLDEPYQLSNPHSFQFMAAKA